MSPLDPRAPDDSARVPGAASGRVPTEFSRRALRVFLIGAVAACVLALVTRAGTVLLLAFAGVLFAIFLNGCARWLARRVRLPYWLALLLTVLVLLTSAGGLVIWLGPRLGRQVAILFDQIPSATRAIVGAERFRGWSRELTGRAGQAVLRDVDTVVATAKGAITLSVQIVGGVAVFLFLGIYGAAQPAVYRSAIVRLVPLPGRARAEEVMQAIIASLRRWLFGRLVAMLFVGVGTMLGFWLLGIPVALALGLLAGLLTFIEYIGAILSAVPPLLLAVNQGWTTVFWVLVIFAGAHVVEGYVLTPLLARRTVRFPPGFTLFVQLLFGLFFGVLGLMLATPVAVVFTRLVQALYVEDVLQDRSIRRGAA
jgi:predicted PurR-regulated permease PerM